MNYDVMGGAKRSAWPRTPLPFPTQIYSRKRHATSRCSVTIIPEEKNPVNDMNVEIHEVCSQFSSEMIEKIKLATTSDQELTMLKKIVHEGWPTSIKEVPQVLKPYWCYRDEISIENGILMKGQRIIIPSTLQVEILGKLHAGTSRCREN
jgi:hypothetical protein